MRPTRFSELVELVEFVEYCIWVWVVRLLVICAEEEDNCSSERHQPAETTEQLVCVKECGGEICD